MMDRMHYRLEVSGTTATLYPAGTLSADDAPVLCDACAALPISVRTLRLDFRPIGSMSADAIAVVRALLRHWRASRRGEFRLSTSYLVATLADVGSAVIPHERSECRDPVYRNQCPARQRFLAQRPPIIAAR
jgi:hypothetical protein